MNETEFQKVLNAEPPIVLMVANRIQIVKDFIMVFLCSLIFLIAILGKALSVVFWIPAIACFYCSLIAIWMIFFPETNSLTLSREGFTVKHIYFWRIHLWRNQNYQWKNVSGFGAKTLTTKSFVATTRGKAVCFDNGGPVDIRLSSNYRLTADQLVQLMNHWRNKSLK